MRAAKVLRASPMAAYTRKSQPKTGHHTAQLSGPTLRNPSSEDTALGEAGRGRPCGKHAITPAAQMLRGHWRMLVWPAIDFLGRLT